MYLYVHRIHNTPHLLQEAPARARGHHSGYQIRLTRQSFFSASKYRGTQKPLSCLMPVISQPIAGRLEAHTCHLTCSSKLLSLDDFIFESHTGGLDGAATPFATWLNLPVTLLGSLSVSPLGSISPIPALPSCDLITPPARGPFSHSPSAPAV